MSSFVVSHATINRILSMLQKTDIQSPNGGGTFNRMTCDELEALGAEMLYFNACATSTRYKTKPTSELPGTIGEKYDDFKLELRNVSLVEGYKALNCYTYQCAEDGWVDHPFYKEMERIEFRVAHRIVSGLPEYESAAWDIETPRKVVQ